MRHKKAITAEVGNRYIKATKKDKNKILDEFSATTNYNRVYAARILRLSPGKMLGYSKINGRKVKYVIGKARKTKRVRNKIYTYDVFLALKKIWTIFDFICSKRLKPFMAEAVKKLQKHKEIDILPSVKEKLLSVSASTIDRLLKPEKDRYKLGKGRKGTKPGTLLKKAIPIRTFSDWNEKKPGYLEADLVGHDGGNASGDYAQSLNFVDVLTGWDESAACINKAQVHVFEAIKTASESIPFKVLGIDSDNGSEFINAQMLRYCIENRITFTRSRAYKKNDSCFVEQKNYSVVRRAVGYLRYDTKQEVDILNELYIYLGQYTNFFMPVVKLVLKTRKGSKVTKKYDEAKTPYRRVLKCIDIDDKIKEKLKQNYDSLNPAELKRKISGLQDRLLKLNALKQKAGKEATLDEGPYGYIYT
ncbi:MAG: transposase family protein [Actinobacteria bacterium]|nr:transposase family protein [Actinomycetota bacterium]